MVAPATGSALMMAPATGSALYGLPTGSQATSPNWGGSYPIWGCFRAHRLWPVFTCEKTGCSLCSRAGTRKPGSAKRSAKVPERDHKKRAPRARRALMSPFADIPLCNRSFTMPSDPSCKSEGDLPSSDCQDGDGHSPSRKTGLAASQGAQRGDQRSGVDPGKPE